MQFDEPKGIYVQIADRMRERILRGDWSAGTRIPSIREMAVELGVNPNTVARSYQALVDGGLIANRRGLGYFVAEDAAEGARAAMRETFLRDELPRIARTLRLLGIGPGEIAARLAGEDRPGPESTTA